MSIEPRWWERERHRDRKPFLRTRGAITRALRRWFELSGFVEVETGILQVSPGNETHLHALRTDLHDVDLARRLRYLRTSPEFACKKLLAAGESKIVEFARVFRDRESGALHLAEFTMIEWYRARADLDTVIDDCIALIAQAAEAGEQRHFNFRNRRADPFAEPERLTVADAFDRHAGIDLLSTIADGKGDRDALARSAEGKVSVMADDDWGDLFSKLLVARVEPQLGNGRVTVLTHYPAPEAALARIDARDPRTAERFEVYACGVELANGYGELTDPVVQRARFEASMKDKERRYGERYPIDQDFLAAVAEMPDASGVAMGLDRLVMLAAGATRLDQIVWTPPT